MLLLILRATADAAPIFRQRVGTGFMLPSARLAICVNAKVVDHRPSLLVDLFDPRSEASKPRHDLFLLPYSREWIISLAIIGRISHVGAV